MQFMNTVTSALQEMKSQIHRLSLMEETRTKMQLEEEKKARAAAAPSSTARAPFEMSGGWSSSGDVTGFSGERKTHNTEVEVFASREVQAARESFLKDNPGARIDPTGLLVTLPVPENMRDIWGSRNEPIPFQALKAIHEASKRDFSTMFRCVPRKSKKNNTVYNDQLVESEGRVY